VRFFIVRGSGHPPEALRLEKVEGLILEARCELNLKSAFLKKVYKNFSKIVAIRGKPKL
jgi:hypothetical protein